jgi:hypothetical protein
VEGVRRIPAPHDHQAGLGVGVVLVAVLDGPKGPARAGRRALIRRHAPGIGTAPEHPQEAPQQAFDLVRLVQHAVGGTSIALVEQCLWAVGILDLEHLCGNEVQGFIPRNTFELAFAALADPHHGIQQALGRVQALAIGTAAQATAKLRLFPRVLAEKAILLKAPIVSRDPHDDIALLVGNQRMA